MSLGLFRFSHVAAGFIAVLVGYSSAAVIVFQAAEAAGATNAEISSWLWALGIGMGMSSIALSVYYRHPVLTAWSTPGAALLVTSLSGVSMNEAVGAFIVSSLLITLCGLSGWFERMMKHVPLPLASAMLAGVLLQFGLDLFIAIESQFVLVSIMLITFLLLRILIPRYVIPVVLCIGFAVTAGLGLITIETLTWELTTPTFIMPSFSLSTAIGVGIPLFVVTMASQNMPGVAVLRSNGYQTPVSPLISCTGITGLLFAPFGGFAFNLAAITAAICMGKEADIDPDKRYLASIWAGFFYILTGVFGATIVGIFTVFPQALVMAIAGLALLGTISNSLTLSFSEEKRRDAALLTFLVTASGLSLGGIGSAFWGLIIGLLADNLWRVNRFLKGVKSSRQEGKGSIYYSKTRD